MSISEYYLLSFILSILSSISIIPYMIKSNLYIIVIPLIIFLLTSGITKQFFGQHGYYTSFRPLCDGKLPPNHTAMVIYFSDLAFQLYIIPCLCIFRFYILAVFYVVCSMSKIHQQLERSKEQCSCDFDHITLKECLQFRKSFLKAN